MVLFLGRIVQERSTRSCKCRVKIAVLIMIVLRTNTPRAISPRRIYELAVKACGLLNTELA